MTWNIPAQRVGGMGMATKGEGHAGPETEHGTGRDREEEEGVAHISTTSSSSQVIIRISIRSVRGDPIPRTIPPPPHSRSERTLISTSSRAANPRTSPE